MAQFKIYERDVVLRLMNTAAADEHHDARCGVQRGQYTALASVKMIERMVASWKTISHSEHGRVRRYGVDPGELCVM